MQEDQIWILISTVLSGEATPEEKTRLLAFLEENPEWKARMASLKAVWAGPKDAPNRRKDELFDRHLQRLSNTLDDPTLRYTDPASVPAEPNLSTTSGSIPADRPTRRTLRWLLPLTSAAAILLGILIIPRSPAPSPKTSGNTVSTKPGSKSRIQLPDGSQVWLNADSRITYREDFGGSSRELTLTGEAYFDITKDKLHPFIIHTPAIDIRVLGTSLNVRSYTNEPRTETVLIRGSIEVSLRNSPEHSIILKPNDKLVVSNIKSAPASPGQHLAPIMVLEKPHFQNRDTVATEVLWMKNELAFDQEKLESVATKIERWYDVKVKITDDRLKQVEYSGVFQDESLPQVMEALRLSGNFRYTLTKKEVIIRPAND